MLGEHLDRLRARLPDPDPCVPGARRAGASTRCCSRSGRATRSPTSAGGCSAATRWRRARRRGRPGRASSFGTAATVFVTFVALYKQDFLSIPQSIGLGVVLAVAGAARRPLRVAAEARRGREGQRPPPRRARRCARPARRVPLRRSRGVLHDAGVPNVGRRSRAARRRRRTRACRSANPRTRAAGLPGRPRRESGATACEAQVAGRSSKRRTRRPSRNTSGCLHRPAPRARGGSARSRSRDPGRPGGRRRLST